MERNCGALWVLLSAVVWSRGSPGRASHAVFPDVNSVILIGGIQTLREWLHVTWRISDPYVEHHRFLAPEGEAVCYLISRRLL